jgi:hypothetical protein
MYGVSRSMSNDDAIPLNKRLFEGALDKLISALDSRDYNPGSYKSKGSTGCLESMFTQASHRCYQCTYCERCAGCSRSTHCHDCEGCHNSSYCVHSAGLVGCSYVVLSQSCFDCIFCFGCVGLVNKEFHILNRAFSKDAYFRLLEKLEPLFGLSKRAS